MTLWRCSVPGCSNMHYGRTLCSGHYQEAKRNGQLDLFPRKGVNSHTCTGPTEIPVGWTPPGGPLPYSETLIAYHQRDEQIALDRFVRDIERYDVELTDTGLVVRERAEVAA